MMTVAADVRPAKITRLAEGEKPGGAGGLQREPTPFRVAEAHYRAALAQFNDLPRDLETTDPSEYRRVEQIYLAAVDEVDTAPLADWQEFADAVEVMFDDGASYPRDLALDNIYATVRRLSGKA